MNVPFHLTFSAPLHRAGWSLVHSLWIGAAIALLAAGLLFLLRRRSANLRYVILCVALTAMPVALAATFFVLPDAPSPAPAAESARVERVQPAESGPAKSLIPIAEPSTPTASNDGDNSPLPFGRGEKHATSQASPLAAISTDKSSAPTAPANDVADPSVPRMPEEKPTAESSNQPAAFGGLRSRMTTTLEPALPWLVAGWLAGMLLLSVWHVGGWLSARRLRFRDVSAVDDFVREILGRLCRRLGIRQTVNVLESARVGVPALLGFLKPVVLLPGSVLTGLTPSQLEAVLAHELAHVRRHDYLVNLVQTAIETLLFFHPAVWWMSRRIRIERENCCDDLALVVAGDRLLYAQSLTRLEELRQQAAGARPAVLTVAASGGSLLDRICRVLGVSRRFPARSRLSTAGAVGLSGLLTIAAALLLLLPGVMPLSPAVSANAAVAAGDDDVPPTRLGDLTVLQDVPIAELKPGATVSLGNGDHRFDEIPDFLRGRSYTKRNGYLGILKFRVEKPQRVYFAVYGADWGGGGNPSGGWRKELVTRKQLEKQGWKEVGKLVGEHTVLDGNRLAWIVFARDCKAGETFAIRTHKYQAPILFSAKKGDEKQRSIKNGHRSTTKSPLDGIVILEDNPWAELKPGATISLGTGAHRIEDVPELLKGRRYIKRDGNHEPGALRFRVTKSQTVIVAFYGEDWGGGGNPSGDWQKELVTRAQLKKQGWKERGKLIGHHTLIKNRTTPWIIYSRDCKAGEQFTLRNHKYRTPLLFSPKKRTRKTDAKGGTPVKGLRLSLTADKTETTMLPDGSNARPVKLKLTFTNVGKKPIKLNAHQLAYFHLKFAVNAPDSASILKSTLIPDIAFKPPVAGDFPVIPPGKSWSPDVKWGQVFPDSITDAEGFSHYEVRKAGFYKLRYTYENPKPSKLPFSKGAWTGSVTSNEFVLMVRPFAKAAKPAPKPIGLGSNRLKIETHAADKLAPGLFAVGLYAAREKPNAKTLYQWRLQKKVPDGYHELVGRMRGDFDPGGNRFEVERFERIGNRINAVIQRIDREADVAGPPVNVYVRAALPALPAGKYRVEISFRDVSFQGRKRIVARTTRDPISCTFEVPANVEFPAELKKLAEAAVALKAKRLSNFPRPAPYCRAAGLDLSKILKLTGQDKDRANLPRQHYDAGITALAKAKKTWALCSLLDDPNPDMKTRAARALTRLADPNSVPSLLAAAKRNNYGVEGSQAATLHMIYRQALKAALEKMTGLKLTAGGRNVIPKEDVDFAKVDAWLRTVYLAPRASANRRKGSRLRIKKGPWKDAKVRVFCVGKKAAQLVAAKRATWELSAEGRSWKRSVIAFLGPSCGLPWAGLEQDGYIDTGTAVSGFHTIGTRIQWHESIIKKVDKSKAMAAILAAFDRDVSIRELEAFRRHPSHETPLNPHIKNPWMFTNGEYNSQPASPRITAGQFDGKSLKLDLTDVTGKFKATVWIDVKSRKLTKVEDETGAAVKGGDVRPTGKILKRITTPKDRGKLSDVYQKVPGGKHTGRDELIAAPGPKPKDQTPAAWFENGRKAGPGLTTGREAWLLFRSKQVDDNDRMWIESVMRSGPHFIVWMRRSIWNGNYKKNVTFHEIHGVDLGKLPAGKYAASCYIASDSFKEFDKSGWPKSSGAPKPARATGVITVHFTVAAAKRTTNQVLKQVKSPKDRGTLRDAYQKVLGGEPAMRDELKHVPPLERMKKGETLANWFTYLRMFQCTTNDNNWLLFRSKQMNAKDRMWIERVERRDSTFTVTMNRATWLGNYKRNTTFHAVYGVKLGKLPVGKYTAKWTIRESTFKDFDKDGWPKDAKLTEDTPVELTAGFTVDPVRKNNNPVKVLKQIRKPTDRGTLHDAYQKVRGSRRVANGDELIHLRPKPKNKTLAGWFEENRWMMFKRRAPRTTNDNNWLLFRSKQLDDNDVEWIERVERQGNEFTITLHRAIWDGDYAKNITFHDLFGINLGKLAAGNYTVKWIIRKSRFLEFDKQRWPKDERPDKPLELNTNFTIVPSRKPVAKKAAKEQYHMVVLHGAEKAPGGQWTFMDRAVPLGTPFDVREKNGATAKGLLRRTAKGGLHFKGQVSVPNNGATFDTPIVPGKLAMANGGLVSGVIIPMFVRFERVKPQRSGKVEVIKKSSDVSEKVRSSSGIFSKLDQVMVVPGPRPPKLTPSQWFQSRLKANNVPTADNDTWVLFRSVQVNDNDRMRIERIERQGSTFAVIMARAIWLGPYAANVKYHDIHGINLGKLPAGKYAVKWIIRLSTMDPRTKELKSAGCWRELTRSFTVPAMRGPASKQSATEKRELAGRVYEDKARRFRVTIPKGWSATPVSYSVQHYRDVFLCINSKGNKALRVTNTTRGDTVWTYSPETVAAQLAPGTVYIDFAIFDGPGGSRNYKGKPDTVKNDLLPLLKTFKPGKAAGGKLSAKALSFIRREHRWDIYVVFREPVKPELRAKAESLLRSFRFVDEKRTTRPDKPRVEQGDARPGRKTAAGWSNAVEGLRMRPASKKTTFAVGEDIPADIVLKNMSDKTKRNRVKKTTQPKTSSRKHPTSTSMAVIARFALRFRRIPWILPCRAYRTSISSNSASAA